MIGALPLGVTEAVAIELNPRGSGTLTCASMTRDPVMVSTAVQDDNRCSSYSGWNIVVHHGVKRPRDDISSVDDDDADSI